MKDIRLLNEPFVMCSVKDTPPFPDPYTFIVSMPDSLMMICPESAFGDSAMYEPYSCFCVREYCREDILSSVTEFSASLEKEHISCTTIMIDYDAYFFVDSACAMDVVMLLARMGYDVIYSDIN